MTTLTIGKIINTYKEYLTDYEIEKILEVHQTSSDFKSQVNALRRALFDEDWDFMMDSGADSKNRSREENPMSQKNMDRVNKKRNIFGLSALSENGHAIDQSSYDFCEEVVRNTKNYKEYLEHKRNQTKQVVFVDMDGVLVNFQSGIDQISQKDKEKYKGRLDEVPGIFSLMEPNEGAIEGYKWLSKNFDTYILSTAPWENPSAWMDILLWVKKYLPEEAYKRLTLTHNKHLANGDFLIDDRIANGAGEFPGKHIFFGPDGHKDFGDWKAVVAYLKRLV